MFPGYNTLIFQRKFVFHELYSTNFFLQFQFFLFARDIRSGTMISMLWKALKNYYLKSLKGVAVDELAFAKTAEVKKFMEPFETCCNREN